MSTFALRSGTPDGLLFEGEVERVVCRSVGGDIAILARHCNLSLIHILSQRIYTADSGHDTI